MKQRLIMLMLVTIMFVSLPVASNAENSFMLSLRGEHSLGTGQIEYYNSINLEGRYFIASKWDVGLSVEQSQKHVIELPGDIETLDPSGEIDGEGTSTIVSMFGVYNFMDRESRFDVYIGASINCIMLSADDVRSGSQYDIEIDAPPAYGISLKAGTHWNFTKHLTLTLDLDVGPVFHNYTVKDKISGLSEDLDSYFLGRVGLGLSVYF